MLLGFIYEFNEVSNSGRVFHTVFKEKEELKREAFKLNNMKKK